MLVGTIDRAIDGDVPIDITGGVGISENLSEDTIPGAVGAVATVSFPHCLPGAEVFLWKVAPGDAGPLPVCDALDDSTVVLERPSSPPLVGRQEWFYALPLFVGENAMSLI